MASTLKLDTLQLPDNRNVLVNGYPRMPGQVVELLSSPCDGSSVTVGSGTYTVQNVTGIFTLADAYADIPGSVLAYTPPAGATRVKYTFQYNHYWPGGTHCISHHKFFIDGVEVVFARHSRSGYYPEGRYSFEWTIAIGGTTNASTGRQATWTAPKTLKMQARRYAAGNPISLHGTTYWDGAGGVQFGMPVIEIEAIA